MELYVYIFVFVENDYLFKIYQLQNIETSQTQTCLKSFLNLILVGYD